MKVINLLCLGLTIVSCNTKKDDNYFQDLGNGYNILKIRKTIYSYEGNTIYSVNTPKLDVYPLYGIGNFMFIKDGEMYMISVDQNCEKIYETKDYGIQNLAELGNSSLDPCNLIAIPFVNFNASVGDTLFFIDKENRESGYWSVLEGKSYSTKVKDTIYKFCRHLGSSRNTNWIYYITPKKGIVGMEKVDWAITTDSLGYPYIIEPVHIPLNVANSDILKYIKNIGHR